MTSEDADGCAEVEDSEIAAYEEMQFVPMNEAMAEADRQMTKWKTTLNWLAER